MESLLAIQTYDSSSEEEEQEEQEEQEEEQPIPESSGPPAPVNQDGVSDLMYIASLAKYHGGFEAPVPVSLPESKSVDIIGASDTESSSEDSSDDSSDALVGGTEDEGFDSMEEDEEDEEEASSKSKLPILSRHELASSHPASLSFSALMEEGSREKLGEISVLGTVVSSSILPSCKDELGKGCALVVVQGRAEMFPLNLGSLVCSRDYLPVGFVHDLFGPIEAPFYMVYSPYESLMGKEEEKEEEPAWLSPGSKIFYSLSLSSKLRDVDTRPGCDASNEYDEELPEDAQELSDDEKEREKKRRNKKGKKKGKGNANQSQTRPTHRAKQRTKRRVVDREYTSNPSQPLPPSNIQQQQQQQPSSSYTYRPSYPTLPQKEPSQTKRAYPSKPYPSYQNQYKNT